jgi:hypothetical protein
VTDLFTGRDASLSSACADDHGMVKRIHSR